MNNDEIIGKLPDPNKEIEDYRNYYASLSRSAKHIAAKQLIDEIGDLIYSYETYANGIIRL